MTDLELIYEKEALEREHAAEMTQEIIDDKLYDLKKKAMKAARKREDEIVHLMGYTYYATHWASEYF